MTVGQSLARFTSCQTRKDCETLDESRGSTQVRVDERQAAMLRLNPVPGPLHSYPRPKLVISVDSWKLREHLSLSEGDIANLPIVASDVNLGLAAGSPRLTSGCRRLKSSFHHHTEYCSTNAKSESNGVTLTKVAITTPYPTRTWLCPYG
ncbi:hypothetical protein BDP81DRAFT_197121 [Colletotrichum phormii]|uniref:Uncharacterized protein n=1 Tax=Colletotrichum phormii TaxID=359342 RepID=A0AAJ0EHK5_9PEZI|nr:uncharacterized protein BDP81DRAFT_197121 [Colletotrichum phormii]KAK1639114.1 hypothetical protein BDP81DRAFT_197121 [Colletotrichum phormii]